MDCDQNQGPCDYCLLWDTNPQSMNTEPGLSRWFGEQAIGHSLKAENTRVIEGVSSIPVSFTSVVERLAEPDAAGEKLEESLR